MENVSRRGAIKDRNRKYQIRVPDLGYYLIITDTKETEKNYFEGLREIIPSEYKNRIVIKVYKDDINKLVQRAIEMISADPHYRKAWIIFDRDEVQSFDQIINQATMSDINVGWSNPCIEIWFYSYFGQIPTFNDSVSCCSQFSYQFYKLTGKEYQKNDPKIYHELNKYGDEISAIKIAKNRYKQYLSDGKTKPSEMTSASAVYLLIEEILKKIRS